MEPRQRKFRNRKHRSGLNDGGGEARPPVSTPVPVILGAKTVKDLTGSSLSYLSATYASEAVRIFDDQLRFAPDEALKLLGENETQRVIGVLGRQGIGKSSILSQICGTTGRSERGPFKLQDEQCRMRIRHQTEGVYLALSGEGIITLDTQPVFSPSVLAQAISNEIPIPGDASTHEKYLMLQDLRLTMLMLTVCHILLVVSDVPADRHLWGLVRTALILKSGSPSISAVSQGSLPALSLPSNSPAPEHSARLAFVLCTKDEYLLVDHIRTKQHLECALGSYFGEDFVGAHAPSKPIAAFVCSSFVSDEDNSVSDFQEDRRFMVRSLIWWCLECQTEPFHRPISHREWLRNSGRVWEALKKSKYVWEYDRILQRLSQKNC